MGTAAVRFEGRPPSSWLGVALPTQVPAPGLGVTAGSELPPAPLRAVRHEDAAVCVESQGEK